MGRHFLHPQLRMVTVVMQNGASVEIPITVNKLRDKIRTAIDPTSHPLWTGKAVEVENKGRVARFNQQFDGFSANLKDGKAKGNSAEGEKVVRKR